MRKDTKARDFDRRAKEAISERDSIDGWPWCVSGGPPAPPPLPWSTAHYLSRAQHGKGIPENGLTLCPECYRQYDQSTDRQERRAFFREYLESKYADWNEDELIYRKGIL